VTVLLYVASGKWWVLFCSARNNLWRHLPGHCPTVRSSSSRLKAEHRLSPSGWFSTSCYWWRCTGFKWNTSRYVAGRRFSNCMAPTSPDLTFSGSFFMGGWSDRATWLSQKLEVRKREAFQKPTADMQKHSYRCVLILQDVSRYWTLLCRSWKCVVSVYSKWVTRSRSLFSDILYCTESGSLCVCVWTAHLTPYLNSGPR
jgi:hypothetical protein